MHLPVLLHKNSSALPTNKHSSISTQLLPLPENPGLQLQKYDPCVLMQLAYRLQLFNGDSSLHSSIS
jgi:hypothetical protein